MLTTTTTMSVLMVFATVVATTGMVTATEIIMAAADDDDNSTLPLIPLSNCINLLEQADQTQDGLVNENDYVDFVLAMAAALQITPTDPVITFVTLPLLLQENYGQLACLFCPPDEFVDELMANNPCCVGIGLDLELMMEENLMVPNTTASNATEDLLLQEEEDYFELVCTQTEQAILEAWGENDEEEEDSTVPPKGRVDTCPTGSVPSSSCAAYQPGLQCEYDFIFTGCLWDTLSCVPVLRCECAPDDTWSCLSLSIIGCVSAPDGLPWGQSCDPNDPLPSVKQVAGTSAEDEEDAF